MKRRYIAVLICLFGSTMIFAQTGDALQIETAKGKSEVRVWIDRIVWNANYNQLEDEANQERAHFHPRSFSFNPSFAPFNHTSYHIAVLRFRGSPKFKEGDTFRFDASIDLSYGKHKPIYFLFADDYADVIDVERIDDYTVRFHITASDESQTLNKAGGGVITTVGIMGRGTFLSGSRCMYLNVENRISETDVGYALPSYTFDICSNDTPETRVETGGASIHSYPNPVQNHLFVETNGLGIQTTNLLNLQGQSVNHQVQFNNTEDRLEISTNRLGVGLYILQLETTSGWVSKKIYVQR